VTIEAAQPELNVIADPLARAYPEASGRGFNDRDTLHSLPVCGEPKLLQLEPNRRMAQAAECAPTRRLSVEIATRVRRREAPPSCGIGPRFRETSPPIVIVRIPLEVEFCSSPNQ
jgi:hypothetical protein